jgi:hypothetical protein
MFDNEHPPLGVREHPAANKFARAAKIERRASAATKGGVDIVSIHEIGSGEKTPRLERLRDVPQTTTCDTHVVGSPFLRVQVVNPGRTPDSWMSLPLRKWRRYPGTL